MNAYDEDAARAAAPAAFRMRRRSFAVELCLTGEFDIASCSELLEEVQQLLDEGCRLLNLDLGGVTFMDAAAIGALVHIDQRLTAEEGVLEVVCRGGQPRRLLEVAGMERAFHLRPAGGATPTDKAVLDRA